jgi:putative chitinase
VVERRGPSLSDLEAGGEHMIDRDVFFNTVRASLFGGSLSQSQVDGMNYLLDVWEEFFETPNPRDGNKWLAYCMATVFHETGKKMKPVEENGGKAYGNPPAKYWSPTGPYNQIYYGRGHVQLTWDTNYQKGQDQLKKNYKLEIPLYRYPAGMLDDRPSALVLYDGMTNGWFTGVGLPKYFNSTTEDPVNARRIVNGTDQASTIAGYYWKFKPAIVTAEPEPEPEPEPAPPTQPPTITITSDQTVWLNINGKILVVEADDG